MSKKNTRVRALDRDSAVWHTNEIQNPSLDKAEGWWTNELGRFNGSNNIAQVPSSYAGDRNNWTDNPAARYFLQTLASNSKNKTNYTYCHWLALEADTTRFPNGEGTNAIATLNKKGLKLSPIKSDVAGYDLGTNSNDNPAALQDTYVKGAFSERNIAWLEGRVRSKRGRDTLIHVDKKTSEFQRDIASANDQQSIATAQKGKAFADSIEVWWENEGIHLVDVPETHREPDPFKYGGEIYKLGKEGPSFTVSFPGYPTPGKFAPRQVEQTMPGHYMLLGSKGGDERYEGKKYWISNTAPPDGSKSGWMLSRTGKLQEVWFSNAESERDEEEKAIAESRPVYQLYSKADQANFYKDKKHGSQEKNADLTAPLLPELTWYDKDQKKTLASRSYADISKTAPYYPSLVGQDQHGNQTYNPTVPGSYPNTPLGTYYNPTGTVPYQQQPTVVPVESSEGYSDYSGYSSYSGYSDEYSGYSDEYSY